MLIKEILPFYKGKYQRRDIQNLAFSLDQVKDKTLFFNLKSDLNLSLEATDRGAIVVSEKKSKKCNQIIVTDIRSQFAFACKRFYHNAVDDLKVYAVTGTNGKTTTAYMLKSILDFCGKKCALIGTNGVIIGNRSYAPTLTTPDPNILHALFYECVESGITHVVIEASAHALYLKKLNGINFQAVGFTNFSQDHLDFFGTMEKYQRAKETLISSCKTRVINTSDSVGKEWAKSYACLSYNGVDSDLVAQDITLNGDGSDFTVRYNDELVKTHISIAGRYNISNSLCAIGLALTEGISLMDACSGLQTLKSVLGRMNVIKSKTRTVVIDFAHTDDGLKNLLTAVRDFTKGKIITVFGCGGNRDKSKRAPMGKVVSTLSDITVVTSDNPRYERADEIIKQIEKGIDKQKLVDYFTMVDRTNAIYFALEKATQNDTVVIAGKGAENYMEIGGEKLPYSDYNCVNEWIKENEN